MTEAKKSLKRTLVGKVVSDKRAKTVTVLVERRVKHPIYDKIMIRSSKYHAHDEQGDYHMGDLVVVCVVLARPDHDLAVQRVLDTALDQDRHGLGALVAHHLADQGAFEGFFGFRHVDPYLAARLACFCARMVLARAMSRRVTRSVPCC